MRTRLLVALAVLLVAPAARAEGPILGQRPTYTAAEPSVVPNAQAIRTRIWVPGLDEGYVPQGLTFAEGQLLVSLYLSTDASPDRGPSRVYHVDPSTGAVTGRFELPPDVGHPGGLAYAGGGVLYVADAGKLYRLDLPRALATGDGRAASLGRVAVEREMGPSFLAWDGRRLWFGRYLRSETGRLWGVDPGAVFGPPPRKVTPAVAARSFDMAPIGQGATFDRGGRLWLSQSNSRAGTLQEVDPTTGRVLREFALMPGLEDLARGPDGALWSLSEAGSKRWLGWGTFYPLIFELDVNALR
ncbi:MAG TPA: hypothetical protein DDZ42_21945 [Candidatus Rokubacteria bacterium]|nr:hypothetical protein [Candidatus Rokubacteria bacterium]